MNVRATHSLAACLSFGCVLLFSPALDAQSLVQPNGGDLLVAGDSYRIEWTLDESHEQYDWDLWYSISGESGPWIQVEMDIPVGDPTPGSVHTFDWLVPETMSSRAIFRVRQDNVAAFADVYGHSDGVFRIRHREVPGDIDDDGDVDLDDHAAFWICLAGPGDLLPPEDCTDEAFARCDADDDGDVDASDYATIQIHFTGPPLEQVRYRLVYRTTWSVETHPIDFPGNPHFSGLIGGTHGDLVRFWEEGETASPGIETMAESGSKVLLQAEVEAEIDMGRAGVVLSGGGVRPSPGSRVFDFSMSNGFPEVTLVSMIAPSPDWFVGVSGFPLFQDNRWIEEVTVSLPPWDAGTDSGPTYGSSNNDTDPQEPISEIRMLPFAEDGTVPRIGTFTFTRID